MLFRSLGNIDAGLHKRSIWYEQPTIAKGSAISEEQRVFVEAIRFGSAHKPSRAADVYAAIESMRVAEEITRQIG